MLTNDSKKILIVEDDEAIRLALRMLLESEGYHVDVAIHGGEAIDYLHTNTPNLIILDLMMPVVDGFEFRKEQKIHKLCLDVPIIVMSADGNVETKLAKIEGHTYLRKPFNIDELLNSIAEIMM